MHDVIVVGGGLGGCGVAALLAKKGLDVVLIEPGKHAGGRCTSYEKDGFTVPTYIHAFPRTHRGPLADIARELGEPLEWVRTKWFPLNLMGRIVNLPIGGPLATAILKPLVREAGVPLRELLKIVARAGLELLFQRGKFQNDLKTMDVRSWLNKYTDNETIHSCTAFFSLAAFVAPYWELSMDEFAAIFKSMIKAGAMGYPKKGCGAIPEAYLAGFAKAGGKVMKKRVKKILVRDRRVCGVELTGGEKIEARIVISNAGIKPTVQDLVGENHLPADYVSYVGGLKHSLSAVIVKIALDKEITDAVGGIYIPTKDPVGYFTKLEKGELPDDLMVWVTFPSNLSPGLAPEGKQFICVAAVVYYRPDTDWTPWVDGCLKSLERWFPEFPKHILWRDVVTAEQINKWVGKEGTVIGIAQTPLQTGKNRPSIKTPLEGLFLVGADVGTRAVGTELAAESALRCASEVEKHIRDREGV